VTDWGVPSFSDLFAGETLWPTKPEESSGSLKLKRDSVSSEVNMKKHWLLMVVASFGASFCFTVGAGNAPAQGPAGAGASAAAKDTSSHGGHSLNPIKWVKKDSKPSADSRSDMEKKLTPKLQAQGLLTANLTATDACAPFIVLDECLASLHASHNLGIDFNCVRADVTGVHTNVDLSGCKGSVGDKAQNLTKSLHMLKPDADAKGQAKNAEKQAKDDLKDLGS
jgi:hypothetical protein